MLCHQIYNLMFLVTLLGQVCHSLQVEGDFFTGKYSIMMKGNNTHCVVPVKPHRLKYPNTPQSRLFGL